MGEVPVDTDADRADLYRGVEEMNTTVLVRYPVVLGYFAHNADWLDKAGEVEGWALNETVVVDWIALDILAAYNDLVALVQEARLHSTNAAVIQYRHT